MKSTDQAANRQSNNSPMPPTKSIGQQKSERFLKKRMTLIMVVGICLTAMLTIPILKNMWKAHQLQQAYVHAEAELALVEHHQDDLEYYINLLSDDTYVAKLARNDYYMTQEGEIVFHLPNGYIPDYQRMIERHRESLSELKEASERS